MAPATTSTLHQNIFTKAHAPIVVKHLYELDVTAAVVDSFLTTVEANAIGVSAAYGTCSVLSWIAFASAQHVLFIQLSKANKAKRAARKKQGGPATPLEIIEKKILCHPGYLKLAFDAERLVAGFFLDLDVHVAQLIDLQSINPTKPERHAPDNYMKALGFEGIPGKSSVNQKGVWNAFIAANANSADPLKVAARAWASRKVATISTMTERLLKIPGIDTRMLNQEHLAIIARSVRNLDRLAAMKPTVAKNDVKADFSIKQKGDINVGLTRFKTRLRTSYTQTLKIEVASNKGIKQVSGMTAKVKGKNARVVLHSSVSSSSTIKTMYTLGRDEPTPAESERTRAVISFLQGSTMLFEQPFTQRIYGLSAPAQRAKRRKQAFPSITLDGRELNLSQVEAVVRMKSARKEDGVVLVHGPPGTGKTTVIAAYVCDPEPMNGEGIWLTAQSNVAVKNIAEKLADVGFLDFRVVVSQDFHLDWHEHLYEKIEERVIRSDTFDKTIVGNERRLGGAKVILCTLSMFSYSRLRTCGFTRLVPVETVIVDEASQIELGDYLPLLSKFGEKLKKLVFIGDDKQLAPYGQDDLRCLQSIFEMKHLRTDAVFLDIQYRMPVPIGAFISEHVYGGKLKTHHNLTDRNTCRLVDVAHGREESKGHSWINPVEADAAIFVARRLYEHRRKFKIITPYDPQRNLIETKLKAANLPWENTCFNVDSFQGNEEDYIIISVVRTDKVGFLKNLRRTNVMLSRCRRGMIVCANKQFLLANDNARKSLVGKMAAEWKEGWVSWRDLLQGKI